MNTKVDNNSHILIEDNNCVISYCDNLSKFIDTEKDLKGKNIYKILPFGYEIRNYILDYEKSKFKEFIKEYEMGNKIKRYDDKYLIQNRNYDGKFSNFTVQSKSIDKDKYLLILKPFDDSIEKRFGHLFIKNNDYVAKVINSDEIPLIKSFSSKEYVIDSPENILDSVHENDVNKLKEEILSIREEEVSNKNIQCRIKTDYGWKMNEVKIYNKKAINKDKEVIITFKDISDRFRFEQRRRVINRVLRHDLRNDMNVVSGHASMLQEFDNWKIQKHANKIKEKSDSLVRISEEVRKVDQNLNNVNRRIKEINICNVIDHKVESMHRKHPECKFTKRTDCERILGSELVPVAVREAVENAIVHNDKSDKKVEIKTYNKDDSVIVEISDNGQGIVKSERDVINKGLETKLNHISGLGLWLMKWIVDSVGGDMKIINSDKNDIGTVVKMRYKSPNHFNKDDINYEESLNMKDRLDSNDIETTTR